MFSADEKTIAELRDLRECLAAVDPTEATALDLSLDGELNRRTPDLTGVLLRAADSAGRHGLALGRTLMAACCRAFCARLGELHPGASIEVRVPPWAAVQVGFGGGARNTPGGTTPRAGGGSTAHLLGLATGRLCWAEAEVKISGSQAERVAAIFPITAP